MGADFICCYIPAAKIDEDRKRRLLEIAAAEEPRDWEDSHYESAEDYGKAIAAAVEYLAGLPNRETVVIDFPGAEYPALLTGGMSWGDTPTDAFDHFDVILVHAPAVVELLERWARQDHREKRRRGSDGKCPPENETDFEQQRCEQ